MATEAVLVAVLSATIWSLSMVGLKLGLESGGTSLQASLVVARGPLVTLPRGRPRYPREPADVSGSAETIDPPEFDSEPGYGCRTPRSGAPGCKAINTRKIHYQS